MKNVLIGSAIAMTSSGATMIGLEHFYGAWFLVTGLGSGLSAIIMHARGMD